MNGFCLHLQAYWGYELTVDSMDAVIEKYSLQKISLLRLVIFTMLTIYCLVSKTI